MIKKSLGIISKPEDLNLNLHDDPVVTNHQFYFFFFFFLTQVFYLKPTEED